MIKFEKDINGIHFNVNFVDSLNVLKGASGTGKTFLFNTICSYCMLNKISYAYIDYTFVSSADTKLIPEHCHDKDLIILDNADLYLTPQLFSKIRELDSTIILSKKTTFGLDMSEAHMYVIEYVDDSLSTRRLF